MPGWLLSPKGPLSVRPRYLKTLAPWLIRFARASRRQSYLRSVAAIARLNRFSESLCRPLYEEADLVHTIRPVGAIHLYETRRERQRSMAGWALRAEQGISFRHLEPTELGSLEPALASVFAGATFIEDWHLVSDPRLVTEGLTGHARGQGVRFVQGSVTGIGVSDHSLRIHMDADQTDFEVDRLVLAAGAWARSLAADLGNRIPVEAERGYNTTFPDPGISLGSELIFGEHGFVATQLECGLRIGGGAEFAGLNETPNYARADAMVAKARRFLPGLQTRRGERWMGCRPSLPDNRPVIGHSRRTPRVLYAFGHGHLGLTQAPGTARLITDLALDRAPGIDIKPYSPDRFD